MHEGDRYVTQADVAKHDVDTEDASHGEDSPPSIMAVYFNEWFHLQHLDGDVGTNCRYDEVHSRDRQWKLEVQFLNRLPRGKLLAYHASRSSCQRM